MPVTIGCLDVDFEMRNTGSIWKERTVCVAKHHWIVTIERGRGYEGDRLRLYQNCHTSAGSPFISA